MSYDKYIKYKTKYLQLKAKNVQQGGAMMRVIDSGTTPITITESELLDKRKIPGQRVVIGSKELSPNYRYSYVINADGISGTRTSMKDGVLTIYKMTYKNVPDASQSPGGQVYAPPPLSSAQQAPPTLRSPPGGQVYAPPSGPFITDNEYWTEVIAKHPYSWLKNGNIYIKVNNITEVTTHQPISYLELVNPNKCIFHISPVRRIIYERLEPYGIKTETPDEGKLVYTADEAYDEIDKSIESRLRTSNIKLSELLEICKTVYADMMHGTPMPEQKLKELKTAILKSYQHDKNYTDPLFYKQ